MIALLFVALVNGQCKLPIPRATPLKAVGCICTDSGETCVCQQGDCLCKDCPTHKPSTPVPAKAKEIIKTRTVYVEQPQVNYLESWQAVPCRRCQR